jgi:O-acetyl-ADP-ribose deacetylase (regulator of RNase III)
MSYASGANLITEVKKGDVLTESADVLICSANVYLNLSGGVGGEILVRYGDEMQRELHAYLKTRGLRFVQPGEVVVTKGFCTNFKHVLHAVAVDAFYGSSATLVKRALVTSFELAGRLGAVSAAMVAIGTGYGHLGIDQFSLGLCQALPHRKSDLESIRVVVRTEEMAKQIRTVLATAASID